MEKRRRFLKLALAHSARLAVILAGSWCFVAKDQFAHAQSVAVDADLAFIFHCSGNLALDEIIGQFLTDNDFRVLNQVRSNRNRGIASNFSLLIFGLDEKNRIIKFNSLPPREGVYAASLMTPPPTRRSSDLEGSLINLVSKKLGCDISQVARRENGLNAAAAYKNQVETIERLFRDAKDSSR